MTGGANTGGLVGELSGGGSVVASYSTAVVTCAGAGGTGAGLVGNRAGGNSSSVAASYSTGRVTGPCASAAGFALGNGGAVTASYWDAGLSGIADDGDSNAPEGKATADLQAPTDYDALVGNPGEAVYATWDDQDVDGDGATGDGDDADPWDFGRSNQHPILKYRGLAAAPQLDAQPDTAPAFATSTLAAMTFPGGVAIQSFQLPAVTAGNGAYVYTPTGLPEGLSLGAPNCVDERAVCGTPTAATSTTVTVVVEDSDGNDGPGDRDAVTFMVTVPPASARVAGTVPTSLTETNLHGATVRVELSGTVFDARIAPSSFELETAPTINGLSIASAIRTSDTEASLRLRFDRTDFANRSTLLVRVLAAAHRFGGDRETGTVPVAPAAEVALSATEMTLEEDPGSTNANYGSYTIVLTGQPPGVVTVTPTSSNPDVTLSGSVSFNATTWNSPATVGVTAGRDDDAADDVAHVTHAVQGLPGVSSGPRVRVAVNDDDTQGLTLATTTLAGGVTEGSSATYAVRLDTEPTGPVTVAISGGDGAVAVDADSVAPGDQSTLLFHAMNWDTARTVTVRALEDDDGADGSATLTHDPSGADYGGVADVDVSFTVTDDDAKGATPSATTLTVQENGSASYALVLDTEPVGGAGAGGGDEFGHVHGDGESAGADVLGGELERSANDHPHGRRRRQHDRRFGDGEPRGDRGGLRRRRDHRRRFRDGCGRRRGGSEGDADDADGRGGRDGDVLGAPERRADGDDDGDGGRRHCEADGGRGPGHARRPDDAVVRFDELERGADGDGYGRGGRRRRGRDGRPDARRDGRGRLRLGVLGAASRRGGAGDGRRDGRGGGGADDADD